MDFQDFHFNFVLFFSIQMVQVQYAHSKRVRHNHIKPECFVIRGFQLFLTGDHHVEVKIYFQIFIVFINKFRLEFRRTI